MLLAVDLLVDLVDLVDLVQPALCGRGSVVGIEL